MTVERLKEAYSIFNQAISDSELEIGDFRYWDYSNDYNGKIFASKYIIPYLKGVKKVNSREYSAIESLDRTATSFWVVGIQKYTMSNGMVFAVRTTVYEGADRQKSFAAIAVDINGYKKPNRMGRDVFIMSLYPYVEGYKKKKLVFGNHEQCGNGAHHYLLSRNSLVNSGCGTCNSNHSGYGFACGLLIQMDGWQIKNDYPW